MPTSPRVLPRIMAVIVTYHPDLENLRAQMVALSPQVNGIVVVDNGSTENIQAWVEESLLSAHVIQMGKNAGIAAAQNAGIVYARACGEEAVLLMDQDSCPAPDMIEKLWSVCENLKRDRVPVAAVGPQIYDHNSRTSMNFYQSRGLKRNICSCAENDISVFDVDSIIASGSLIPLNVLADVGDMRADFFIDYVDIEWCLRAQQKGYKVFAVCAAKLFHNLGHRAQPFLGKRITLHGALRYYYMFRNGIYLLLWVRLPWGWKVQTALSLARKYVFFSIATPPRWKNFSAMTRGIWDGLCRRMS